MANPHVVVVGGGVAGMTAALELRESGCDVTLFEMRDELGGKLGGVETGGRVHEHGYHFFADYCVNFLESLNRLGLGHTLEPREAVKFLRRGEFPRMSEIRNPSSERFFWHNAQHGPVEWPHWVLYVYSVLDLMLAEFQERDFLDLWSVNSWLATKPYITVDAALLHQQSLLKTLSLASYRTAISSYQRGVRYTLAYGEPMMRVMKQNALDGYIRPFEALLQSLGVCVYRETKVRRIVLGERSNQIYVDRTLPDGSGGDTPVACDAIVLAVPIECLSELMDDRLYEATSRSRRAGLGEAPPLANVRELMTAPMASLDIQFKRRIAHMPKEHITFLQSDYDLSCIDLSQLWQTGEATYINAVATDARRLAGLSEQYWQRVILDEVLEYLGQTMADVESVFYRNNLDAPLFLNEIGSWHDRPESFTPVPSLVVAGDFVRNSFGIASVEGAILSAKQAAICLSRYLGLRREKRRKYLNCWKK